MNRLLRQDMSEPEEEDPIYFFMYESKQGMCKWTAIWFACVFAICVVMAVNHVHKPAYMALQKEISYVQ